VKRRGGFIFVYSGTKIALKLRLKRRKGEAGKGEWENRRMWEWGIAKNLHMKRFMITGRIEL
jgi:hypothetical protein